MANIVIKGKIVNKCISLVALILSIHCWAQYDVNSLPWIKAQDGDELKFVSPLLPENPTILEAGVCDGSDTYQMKKKWPQATIYGFEALPDHFRRAREKTKHLSGITLYPCALFDRIGTLTFYASQKIPGASSLLRDNLDNIEIPKDIHYDGVNYLDLPITVSCTTVDAWAAQANVKKIDYIWLDTEGAELYILRNAQTILSTVKVISTEVNFKEFRKGMTLFPDLYEFLTQQGFELKYIWGRKDWQAVAIFVRS